MNDYINISTELGNVFQYQNQTEQFVQLQSQPLNSKTSCLIPRQVLGFRLSLRLLHKIVSQGKIFFRKKKAIIHDPVFTLPKKQRFFTDVKSQNREDRTERNSK